MKKISLVVLFTLFLGIFTGCGSNSSSDTKTITVAFNQSENHPQYQALKELGEAFKEATDGRYEFDIQANAVLGDQKSTLESVQSGVIDISVVGNPIVENYNKDFAVIGLPYVYKSSQHQEEVFTSGVLDDLFASTKDNGFEILGAYTAGARSVYTDTEIITPDDLSGQKIRVMESDTMVRMLNAMGGVGTPMAQGEVYTSVQQGILDGAENNEITYADLKHYEIAPIFSRTQHLMVPDLIAVSNKLLDGMTAEDQATFRSLVKESISNEFGLWNDAVDKAIETAESNGATFVDADKDLFIEATQDLVDEIISANDDAKALYEKINELYDEQA